MTDDVRKAEEHFVLALWRALAVLDAMEPGRQVREPKPIAIKPAPAVPMRPVERPS